MSVANRDAVVKMFSEIRKLSDELCEKVQTAVEKGTPLYDFESLTLGLIVRMGHAAVEALLLAQGSGDLGPTIETESGETLRRSKEPRVRKLRSLFGQHEFVQFVYSTGSHRAVELRPLDARLELSPRVGSYLLEEFAAMFCVETAFGQAATNIERVFGQRLSVDTLEALTRHMGTDAAEFLAQLPTPPQKEEGEILVATLDGKGVPLIQNESAPTKAFETRKLRPGNRRMATVAGAYSVNRYERAAAEIVAALFRDPREAGDLDDTATKPLRPAPSGKHLSVHFPEPYEVVRKMVFSTGATEAAAWLAQEVTSRRGVGQPLLVLGDGDHRLWESLVDHLPSDRVEILDIVHVSAYVWEAAGLLYGSASDRERFARDRLLKILSGGVKSVITGLRRLRTQRSLSSESRRRLTVITNYLSAHSARMRYDEHLRAGFPIATGVIEGACRHLVKDRMERSGMRWTLTGAKTLLHIRSIRESNVWPEFHAHRRQTEAERLHPHKKLVDTLCNIAL